MTDMSIFGSPSEGEGRRDRIYGVVLGVVTNNVDEKKLGRVKVKFPWLSESDESYWARVAMPMGGADRGFFFIPDVNDEVLIVFEKGMKDRPYVIGVLWNDTDKPPANVADEKNTKRFFKSKTGSVIEFDDTAEAPKITIADKEKKASIVIDSKKSTVTITCEADVTVTTKGKITLDTKDDMDLKCKNLTVTASGNYTVKSDMEVSVEGTSAMKLVCAAGIDLNNQNLLVLK